MAKTRKQETLPLATKWNAPDVNVGAPLYCFATTYTFDGAFFESDLLSRFLNLKFDGTEGGRAFIVEREEALAKTHVSVLVDAAHVSSAQTTLRWNQLPVRVPGGAQHSKVVVLAWERRVRLIVSSANLTRTAYRRSREMAGIVDFFDDAQSAPRSVIDDALRFLEKVYGWLHASDEVRRRLAGATTDIRKRMQRWQRMPAQFTPRERPRVTFVSGLPRDTGGVANSPLEHMIRLWGNRTATEVTVMTPFAPASRAACGALVDKLLEVRRTRNAPGALVVPGRPHEVKGMVVLLPQVFRDEWTRAWKVTPDAVHTYVVPPKTTGEASRVERHLHAKAVLLGGDRVSLLMCGSSNFSSSGMGVRPPGAAATWVPNIEANLCYEDGSYRKWDGLRLDERLPVDWTLHKCDEAHWPEEVEPVEKDDEAGAGQPPAVFLWASVNQQDATLTIALDLDGTLPREWSIRLPGPAIDDAGAIADHHRYPQPPSDGVVDVALGGGVSIPGITTLTVTWVDDQGEQQRAILPVQVESEDHLLPPDELQALSSEAILDFLLSGREPAELVDGVGRRGQRRAARSPGGQPDALRAVDTRDYALYRTRRLGRALAALSERITETAKTPQAIGYRLRQDPLGPRMLARALVREWEGRVAKGDGGGLDTAVAFFALAELALVLAQTYRRIGEKRLQPLFGDVIGGLDDEIRKMEHASNGVPRNLRDYTNAARELWRVWLPPGQGGAHAS